MSRLGVGRQPFALAAESEYDHRARSEGRPLNSGAATSLVK